MKRNALLPMFLVGLACLAGGAQADDTLPGRLEAAVPEGFSGQVVVGDADGILYAGNFGLADREAEVAVTSDTLFDIGSITKTFTATLVLKLAADGKLSLQQRLSDWFENLPDRTSSITVEQLLIHTSGLRQYSGDDDAPCDRACFDAWLAEVPLTFSPGTQFAYSNPGYSVLARIIEKVSGMGYEAYLHEALVEPLDLGPIGYLQLPEDAHYAVGYLEGKRVGTPPELVWAEDGPSWHLRGNGGLICSATTLYRWLQASATGRTLPADWQEQQLTAHSSRARNVSAGYGWAILAKPWGEVIDHTGGNGFFFADARWFREPGILLAITSNAFDLEQIKALEEGVREALGMSEEAAGKGGDR